jgi:hypothetical protein
MGGLSVPQILVNDEVVFIKPNSFTFSEGAGERNVRTKSGGAGAVVLVVTENAETQTSKVKFTLLTENSSLDKIVSWLNNFDNNRIEAGEGSFARTFSQATITNDPEAGVGESGEVEVEWTTQRAI